MTKKIAFFISPHGFGHATRSLAIMASLRELDPEYRFEIFSQIPEFLLDHSIAGAYEQHDLACDVGIVQQSALEVDLEATLAKLDDFLPLDEQEVERLAARLQALNCGLVVCDISPLGLAAGKAAGIPTVLVENFTWDWIYSDFVLQHAQFAGHIKTLAQIYREADVHIQTAPPCQPKPGAHQTSPVARKLRMSREEAREVLRVKPYQKLVTITMGGVNQDMDFLRGLHKFTDHVFIIPSLNAPDEGNVRGDGDMRRFYHPDLINASDAVVGKLGYSTVAEVYQAGVPFGYIERANFRESAVLARFIRKTISGAPFSETGFVNGWWLGQLRELLASRRQAQPSVNGADQAAGILNEAFVSRNQLAAKEG